MGDVFRKLMTFCIALICAATVQAGDVEDADAAFARNDYATALKRYKAAAGKSDAYAQTQLGNLYHGGLGIKQDYAEAIRWYKLAAAQGNSLAQFNLGTSYGKGKGVTQNYLRAHMWLNLAAIGGDASAVKNLEFTAARMTSKQIAEAQELARECQARNFKNCD